MYEDMTYEALLQRALSRLPATIDKREGSMVMNGVAPSMAELAMLYIAADFVFRATYLLTAPREYLIKRAADRNMAPYGASAAVFRGEFNVLLPLGARFSCDDLNFVATERMPEKDENGHLSYRLICETAGAVANGYTGTLIPVEYVDGLTYAELVELLVPGEDEEETEAFRQRVLDSYKSQAFGGNQADYVEKVNAMEGVGAVKVHPVWNGGISPASFIPSEEVTSWYEGAVGTLEPAVAAWLTAVHTAAKDKLLTVGGTVKLVILAADNRAPSEELLQQIQTAIDPTQNAGDGLGLAPIGHVVHVVGVTAQKVNITLHITYAHGWEWDSAKSYIEKVIDDYLLELSRSWASSDFITVRISQIESRILAECATMVTDLGGTEINGKEENLVLDADSIPVRGTVDG